MNYAQKKAPDGNGGYGEMRQRNHSAGISHAQHRPRRKRLPPYAQTVLAYLRGHNTPQLVSLRVFVGSRAWNMAKGHDGTVLVLPAGEAPEVYDWAAVAKHHKAGSFIVIDAGSDPDTLKRTARALIHAGGNHVAIGSKQHGLSFFKAKEASA